MANQSPARALRRSALSIAGRLLAAMVLLPGAAGAQQAALPGPLTATASRLVGPPGSRLDPALAAEVVSRASRLPQLRTLIVARGGRPVIERRFRGPGLDVPVNVKSASKTLLSALVGAAIARGVLTGVEQKASALLGSRVPPQADPRVREITIEHLLTLRAGLEATSGANYGRFAASPDWVRFALTRPFVDEPGGAMIYSTGSSHLLGAALTRASGESLLTLAREWLGKPLGIDVPPWPRDPQGIYFGGNDMLLSPRALLAFGELYRNGGVHRGRRVLPAAWVKASWTPRTVSPWSGFAYGYGWFIARAGRHPVYFARGYGGQMLYVVPSLALTAVMTSDPNAPGRGGHVDALHALLTDFIVPAAERAKTV
jgi:CubicO group peptidase (beta-lactamase class C family)